MLHAETAPAELVYGESSYMVGKAQVVLITLINGFVPFVRPTETE